jgi:DNA-binding NarL/FixJ family response regulator
MRPLAGRRTHPRAPAHDPEGDTIAAPRILIVEDHVFFSEALRMLLGRRLSEEHGEQAEFRLAATLADGLRIANEEGPFDVAVVDLVLPDGDGTEVVRRIKAAYPRTLVAVLSSVRDLAGALEAGADEALGKAVPLSVIIEALGRLASGEGRPATT